MTKQKRRIPEMPKEEKPVVWAKQWKEESVRHIQRLDLVSDPHWVSKRGGWADQPKNLGR